MLRKLTELDAYLVREGSVWFMQGSHLCMAPLNREGDTYNTGEAAEVYATFDLTPEEIALVRSALTIHTVRKKD
jgi:hypothetical protein